MSRKFNKGEHLMLKKYLICFFMSMVPMAELRVAVPMALGMNLPVLPAYAVCILGNMLPVPIIYFFARKVLVWGADKKYIGKFFTYCLEKGEKAGRKLAHTAGRRGLFVAMMLFVGIPLPGTGAWTGSLIASLFNMRLKYALPSIFAGVVVAGIIVALGAYGIVGAFEFLL
jgi:uncharacterized membrane protein